ncbi:hypothetical protein BDV96DRAFT_183920 [Lophiotrema nucula]|uniref:Uncharacterized protein n=1 Tax=Lophiotrema nucula TaxID=690887 RepID=A0A6A5YWI1_9PLEO|nr:hypothetical protein BDV96DRAFT_183920 [Lophiotrema nucula]
MTDSNRESHTQGGEAVDEPSSWPHSPNHRPTNSLCPDASATFVVASYRGRLARMATFCDFPSVRLPIESHIRRLFMRLTGRSPATASHTFFRIQPARASDSSGNEMFRCFALQTSWTSLSVLSTRHRHLGVRWASAGRCPPERAPLYVPRQPIKR